jgi:hypothetical protein
MEQRANTKFCFELGKTATETYEMLQTVYCDEALSCSCVFEQFKQFKDGCEDFRMIQEADVLQPPQNADAIINVCEMVT